MRYIHGDETGAGLLPKPAAALDGRAAGAQFANNRDERITRVVTEIKDNQITLDGEQPAAERLLAHRARVAAAARPPAH